MLKAKRKNHIVQGKGDRPNATRSLTEEEEKKEKPFQRGAFGAENLLALQRTMWWILSLYFAFTQRDGSRKFCLGGVFLHTDLIQDGREMLLWAAE